MRARTGLVAVALCSLASSAGAQRLPAPGRSAAGTDDSTALVQNPANLAFLRGGELRWSSRYLSERVADAEQGHAVAFAFPLPLIPFGTGFRFDAINPPAAAAGVSFTPGSRALLIDAGKYQALTWGLGAELGRTAAFGLSWQRYWSEVGLIDGRSSWTAAFTTRPFDGLGLAAVAHDFNGDARVLGASYSFAAAVRPTGKNDLEIGLEARYYEDPDRWTPRGTLSVDVPFGRLRGDFSVLDPARDGWHDWRAFVGVDIVSTSRSGSSELGLGVPFGTRLNEDPGPNLSAELAIRGFRDTTGIDGMRTAVRVRIEETPTGREHIALLRGLWAIAEREPTVDGVLLELRASPAASFAAVEELRDAVYHLRRHGKRVLCHLEDAGGAELYLCAAANRTLVNPAGGLRFAGLRTQSTYLKGLLERLGVHAEFVRIGAHKSAPEQLTETGPTPTAASDKVDLLQQTELELSTAIAHGRKVTVPRLREIVARGPFIAAEAQSAGLVDGFAFDDELDDQVERLLGRSVIVVDREVAARQPARFGNARRVAIVHVDGNIVDGSSKVVPLVGTKLVGSYTIRRALKEVREDPGIGAVVLRIDSGGGSAMASDVMWREVALTAKAKPLVVSMGGAAASGGYYIAAPATRIFANPMTITGSIGIFYGKADVQALLGKIGVGVTTFKTAPRADAESVYRPFTDEERRELTRKVGQFYDMFLARVAEGRHKKKSDIDAVGQGRVWTGRQAAAHGLVDEIGGLRQALEYARQAAGLDAEAPIVELPVPETTIVGRLLGIEGLHASEPPLLPAELRGALAALAPFAIYAPDQPLALCELSLAAP